MDFHQKKKAVGTIDKYNIRHIIKGYKQQVGQDYFYTYSLMTRINSIRMIIAISTLRGLEIDQLDVQTVFLNGVLDEEISMEQPRLVKPLYGLKQALKQWHEKF